ncbi:MAG: GntR family transcriptional regulator [Janthinobacterium lividum]
MARAAANNVVQAFPPAPPGDPDGVAAGAVLARGGDTLHGALLGELRTMIVQGDLAPGARVPERALCARFAVSRTPLREALKVLAAEELVVLLPRRGARVATLDEARLDHLFEVIGLLEAEAGRLAAPRIAPDAIAEVQSMHYRMRAHFLRGELPEYFALNQAIHAAVLRAAGNPVLIATYASLSGRITRARYMSNRFHPDRWAQAMEEHEEILDALCRRDGERLARLLSEHLRNKRDIIVAQIRAAAGEGGTGSPAAAHPGGPGGSPQPPAGPAPGPAST